MSKYINILYEHIINLSNDPFASVKEIDDCFNFILSKEFMLFYENNEELILGVKFLHDIYCRVRKIITIDELKSIIKYMFIDNENSPHLQSKYNLIQALSRICIHQIWFLCYNLYPRFRNNPNDAIYDALNPIESSQQIFKEIMDELCKQKN